MITFSVKRAFPDFGGFLRAFVLGGAVLLSACDDSTEIDVKQYLGDAQTYMDKGEFRAGIIQAKNDIKQEPKNARARKLLGRMMLEQGNAAGAEIELDRARALGYDENEVVRWLGRALLTQGKFDKAL